MLPLIVLSIFSFANAGYPVPSNYLQHGSYYLQHGGAYVPYQDQHVPVIVNGVPVETPEVQQAKVEHFAAVAKAKAIAAQNLKTQVIYAGNHNTGHYDNTQYHGNTDHTGHSSEYAGHSYVNVNGKSHGWRYKRSIDLGWNQIQHIPHITKEGVPLETPEVQLAKAQHQQAVHLAHLEHQKWQPENGWTQPQVNSWAPQSSGWRKPTETSYKINHGSSYHNQYHGPQHYPVLDKHGVPLETPEVNLAKLQHYAAVQQANSKQALNPWQEEQNGWANNAWTAPQSDGWTNAYLPTYNQHIPKILPNGVPEDTYEVQAARAQHLLAHAQEKSKHAGWEQPQW
ncbi:unnamed protein product [Brassicogethes aeneus]|uniref:Uncharacterized protein n=1 Tax=Brassicogethes aeneus TaxID=1431903 RepID=A0A9P0BJ29_BRAAE|nr:unnamed protein product [Brassicogethes aeneus]